MPGTPATTPKLGLPRYDNATDPADFAGQVNPIVDTVDELALRIETGTLAARPAANALPAETWYLATDTMTVSRTNGSAWSDITAKDAIAGIASARSLGPGSQQAAPGDHTHAGLAADQAAGVASVRTLGLSALQAAAGDHTHAGLAADQVAGVASVRTLGPGAQQAAPGNDPRFVNAGLTDVLQPGAAGAGDLAPTTVGGATQIAAGVYWLKDAAGMLIRHVLASAFTAHHEGSLSSNPRIDSVVAIPTSWGEAPTIQTITGTPSGGATLDNRTGAPGAAGGPALPANAVILRDTFHNPTAPPDGVSAGRDRRRFARGYRLRYHRTSTSANSTTSTTPVSLWSGAADFRAETDGVNVFEIGMDAHIVAPPSGATYSIYLYAGDFLSGGVQLKEWRFPAAFDADVSLRVPYMLPSGHTLYKWYHAVSVSGAVGKVLIDSSGGQLIADVWVREVLGGTTANNGTT